MFLMHFSGQGCAGDWNSS